MIYSGGCRTTLAGSFIPNVLSIYFVRSKTYKPLVPLGSRIVDFVCLPTDAAMRCDINLLFGGDLY